MYPALDGHSLTGKVLYVTKISENPPPKMPTTTVHSSLIDCIKEMHHV
jgi:hypothetical protein